MSGRIVLEIDVCTFGMSYQQRNSTTLELKPWEDFPTAPAVGVHRVMVGHIIRGQVHWWWHLMLRDFEWIAPGWMVCRAQLQGQNGEPWGSFLPLQFYVGETTDMATGMMRCPIAWDWAGNDQPISGIALVGVRRSA